MGAGDSDSTCSGVEDEDRFRQWLSKYGGYVHPSLRLAESPSCQGRWVDLSDPNIDLSPGPLPASMPVMAGTLEPWSTLLLHTHAKSSQTSVGAPCLVSAGQVCHAEHRHHCMACIQGVRGNWWCRGWVACADIDATTVATEPLIVIPFGLRLSSEDAAQALPPRGGSAWGGGRMEGGREGLSCTANMINNRIPFRDCLESLKAMSRRSAWAELDSTGSLVAVMTSSLGCMPRSTHASH